MKVAASHTLESKCLSKIRTIDFSCQVNQKQYRSAICTCRRHRRTQIYRDNNSEQRSVDLGIERVKVIRRNKILLYLPENEGALDVTKKISSKCVGGFDPDQNKSKSLKNIQNIDTPNKGFKLNNINIKRSNLNIKKDNILKRDRKDINTIKKISNNDKEHLKNIRIKTINEKSLSSSSLIEHIYNLESSISDNSKIVSNFNEDHLKGCNTLSLKNNSIKSKSEKPTSDLRNPTIFDKANEILKQGLSWVRESSKDLIVKVNLSKNIHKDVSISSSPPSLIDRSLSSTKVVIQKESINNKEECTKEESQTENVKAMFKMWEKKFNFEDESNVPKLFKKYVKNENETDSIKINNLKNISAQKHKKSKNIFSFFRKKNKDQDVNSFKGKRVTAGRCELSDGIVIKITPDNSRSITLNGLKKDDSKNDKNILQQSWLKKFITKSGDSRKSVQLRWDNKFYGTSSNTLLELKNYTFKEGAIIVKPKSYICPNASLQYDNRHKQNLKFKQDIKACMMPNTIQTPVNKRISTQNNDSQCSSNSKKFRGKSKNHIEIFLPVRHFSKDSNKSSDYITIYIHEEYFSEDSKDQNQYTDEEVYNIIEYESQKSNDLEDEKFEQKLYIGDYLHNIAKETIQTTVQTCREAVVQGNNACVPKAGVMTQEDMPCLEKTMKSQDNPNESHHIQPQRKCDLAETYLRDYYRNLTLPLGYDLLTSPMNKSQSQLISLNGSDNCSYSDLYTDIIMSSKSSTEQGSDLSKIKECKQIHTNHFFSNLRKKTCGPLPPCNTRTCPKDSIEVCKKRKIYACSNKSKWRYNTTDEILKTDTKKSAQSTASFDENNIDQCADINERPLDGILKFKGTSDCINCNNNEKITKKSATVIPDPVCKIPQPPCLEKCASVKNPICTKTSSPTCHARSPECISSKSKVSQTEPSETKVTQTKSPRATPSSSHADYDVKHEVGVVSSITCFCSDENIILTTSESMGHVKEALADTTRHHIPPSICPLDPNSYCCCKPNSNFTTKSNAKLLSPCDNKNATATFYQKSLVNVKKIRCNCIGKRKANNECAPDDPNCNINTDTKKDSRNFVSAKPSTKPSKQTKNNTDDRVNQEGRNLVQLNNEKEEVIDNEKTATIKSESTKEKTNKIESKNYDESLSTKKESNKIESNNYDESLSTKKETNKIEEVNCDEILDTKGKSDKTNEVNCDDILSTKEKTSNEGVNCDEIVSTTEKITNEGENCDEILKDMYKDPCDVIKTQIQEQKEQKSLKSLDDNTMKRKLSVSDIIEINICVKFRNPQSSKTKIRSHHIYNVDEKSDIQNIKSASSQIYQVYKEKGNQIKGKTKDMNFTINIQTVEPKCNLSNEHNINSYYANTFKRDHSNAYSEHLLHDHQPTLESLESTHKVTFLNKQIANFEMSRGASNFASSKTTNSSLVNENISDYNFNITTDNICETSDINSHYKQKVINDLKEEFENTEDVLSINESIKDIVNRKLVNILRKLNKNEKKEVFKQILETVGNMKSINKIRKVKRIKHLMYAVLTSEIHVNEVKSRSTLPTKPLDNSSKSKCSMLNKMFSDKRLKVNTTPTQENGSRESNYITNVSSNVKEKIKRLIGYKSTGCCCSKMVDNGDENCCCNNNNIETKYCCCKETSETKTSLSDQKEENIKDKAIHDSISSKMESIVMTEMSTTMQIESKIISASAKNVSNFSNPTKNMRQARQDKLVYLTSDKVLFFLPDSKDNSRCNIKRKQINRSEDILQLSKTKRAVLNIYSHRTSNSFIKLPKFVSQRQFRVRPNKPI